MGGSAKRQESADFPRCERLRLPLDFRAYLERTANSQYFVTFVDLASARIYPLEVWREMEKALEDSDSESAEKVLFAANSCGALSTIDPQGRLVVPIELRRRLGIESAEVRLMVVKKYVTVWSEATYNERMEMVDRGGLEEAIEILEKKGFL